jgi:ATP-binding cassette subfamily C (CFTR/MRP) protein 1
MENVEKSSNSSFSLMLSMRYLQIRLDSIATLLCIITVIMCI